MRYGLGRWTHRGTRDATVIYTSGAEDITTEHWLLIRSREKKNRLGGTRQEGCFGFLGMEDLFVLGFKLQFCIPGCHGSAEWTARCRAAAAQHPMERDQRWPSTAGAQTGWQRQPKTCSEPQSRARRKPGALAQGSDPACKQGDTPSPAQELFGHHFPGSSWPPLSRSSLATASCRTQLPPLRCSTTLQMPFQLCSQT